MEKLICDLNVQLTGDKNNKAIIFIHGFPFDNSMWKNQVIELSKKYYCVTYDVRGLGSSPVGDGQYTMELFANDLLLIKRELKLNNPILCGLSMGGYIALRTIEIAQNEFSGLILLDTRSEADNNLGKLKRSNAINRINKEGLKDFTTEFIGNCFHPSFIKKNPERFKAILTNSLGFNPIGVKGSLIAMLSRTDTTEGLAKIELPVLVIVGDSDTLTPPEVMRKMSELIKNSAFKVVNNAGHITPVEQPEIVTNYIDDFLKSTFG